MDMPDKLYCKRPKGLAAMECTVWEHKGSTSYTRTDLAQSLADALEHLLVSDRYEAIAQARAALANYRKGE